MNPGLFVFLQRITPQQWLTRFAGAVSYCQLPWLKNIIIKRFIRRYQVNMSEAASSRPEDFPHFNAFFTRPLKPGVREITKKPHAIASPCDGKISQCGPIVDNQIIQAKGRHYSVQALLAGEEHLFRHFQGGQFATIYLAPPDYHRIHMPTAGRVVAMSYVPGKLFSVNPVTASRVDQLFARNTRVITLYETAYGPVAMVFVGAMIVAGVNVRWAGNVNPQPRVLTHWHYPNTEENFINLRQGEECGYFYAGSTIVMLLPNGAVFNPNLACGQVVRMGQDLGSFKPLENQS